MTPMTLAIIVLLFAHFFADFVVQPDSMALEKWHSNKALWAHIGVYTLSLFAWVAMVLAPEYGADALPYFVGWAVFNGLVHFATDYVTSRDSHQLWVEKDVRMFFIMIGLDQFLHYVVLIISYAILVHFII